MQTPELLRLLLLLLGGLLFFIGALAPNEFSKQKSLLGKCLIFGLGVICGVLIVLVGWLFTTPQRDQNICYWTLGFGYSFSLPTAVLLLKSRQGNENPSPRIQLLKAVQDEVKERLQYSLHNEKLIKLPKEEQNEQVGLPSHTKVKPDSQQMSNWFPLEVVRLLQTLGRQISPLAPAKQIAPDKPIIDVFDQPDIAGKLLILGEPGSGKTTTLLELARDLIKRALDEEHAPIPVLLELSAWKDDQQPLAEWLVAELKDKYNIPIELGKQLLDEHDLLPLLDGLDELKKDTRQEECVRKINQFLEADPRSQHLVVCSRWEEYDNCPTRLLLKGAVCLQPLSEEQIKEYLERLKRRKLWASIKADSEWRQLAASPLLLAIMAVAYQEAPIQKGKTFNSPEACRQFYLSCLFDSYIKRRLELDHERQGYKAEETKRWLIWLAKTLKDQKQTEFIIEKMQPACLKQPKQKLLYQLSVGLIFGLIITVIILAWLVFLRLRGNIISAFLLGIVGGLMSGLREKIEPIETLKFSLKNVFSSFWNGFTYVLILMRFWLLIILLAWLALGIFYFITGQLTNSILIQVIVLLPTLLFPVLISAPTLGLIYGLGVGLRGSDIAKEKRKNSNQGIWQTRNNAVWFALIGILSLSSIFMPIGWVLGRQVDFLFTTVIFGLIVGLFPGLACIQHFVLRRILWQSGAIPRNYNHFLRYAADRRLIQPVGGRYRFIHDLLRDHFAEMG